jgi:hypothetical protein
VVPLHSIANTTCGHFKPVLNLIFGLVTLPFLVGIIWIVKYFLDKSLLVSVTDNSGTPFLIAFKPSVIEGVKLESKDAFRVVAIINKLVLRCHQPSA